MIFGFIGCQENDDLEFTIQPPKEGIAFANTFLPEYTITPATSSNIAERFVWNAVVFEGTPTAVTYDVQYSATADFATHESLATTDQTNMAVTVEKLLMIAETAGLDNDPATDDKPNTGSTFFRVRAYTGNGGADALESITEVQEIKLVLPEIVVGSGIEISTWGIVGSGFNDWGNGGPDAPFYTTEDADVIVAYATLLTGEVKFRENNDWANNFGDNGADGTLEAGGANIATTAGTYKVTFNTANNTYTIEPYSLGVVGSGFNDWGNGGPDAQFHYDYTTNTFKAGVKLLDGEIKFRLNNDWAVNYGGSGGTITGDNIPTTAGFYTVTLDLKNNTYAIDAADIYGIVGSGYNDWGNGGPDFSFTEVNPNVFVADNVTLLDGEIKFRLNEDWGTNYGGANGVLVNGGDNIATTAGKYQITLNFTDDANPTYTIKAL